MQAQQQDNSKLSPWAVAEEVGVAVTVTGCVAGRDAEAGMPDDVAATAVAEAVPPESAVASALVVDIAVPPAAEAVAEAAEERRRWSSGIQRRAAGAAAFEFGAAFCTAAGGAPLQPSKPLLQQSCVRGAHPWPAPPVQLKTETGGWRRARGGQRRSPVAAGRAAGRPSLLGGFVAAGRRPGQRAAEQDFFQCVQRAKM